jgi:hypothetical protein
MNAKIWSLRKYKDMKLYYNGHFIPWIPILAIQILIDSLFVLTCYFNFIRNIQDKVSNMARNIIGCLSTGIVLGCFWGTIELSSWLGECGVSNDFSFNYAMINIIIPGVICVVMLIQYIRKLAKMNQKDLNKPISKLQLHPDKDKKSGKDL